jgi:hypothetical protein
LELDIEQLSAPALRKLWDLCCKALPGFKMQHAPPPTDEAPRSAQTKEAAQKAKKKRKPMHAKEQEDRIAAIEGKLAAIKKQPSGMEGVRESIHAQGADHEAESSEEDSEED